MNFNNYQLTVQLADGLADAEANLITQALATNSVLTATQIKILITQLADQENFVASAMSPSGSTSPLGVASSYAILAYTAITNTGSSIITGNVGVSPSGAITPGGWTVHGTVDTNDTASAAALSAAQTQFTTMQTLGLAGTTIASALDGQTLTPGAYKFASGAATLAQSGPGTLTFNGAGRYIIYTASTLTTGAGGLPTMTLTNGATAANIFFIVGSSATINSGVSATGGVFQGNILAEVSITDTEGGTVNGSMIALTGAVTLSAVTHSNAIPGLPVRNLSAAQQRFLQNALGDMYGNLTAALTASTNFYSPIYPNGNSAF